MPTKPCTDAPAPPRDPRRALGQIGEQLAEDHLRRLGLVALARNARTRHGELDLVAFDAATRTLVFVEVKTRRLCSGAAGAPASPLEAIGPRKRARVRRLAAAWLSNAAHTRPKAHAIRFDAIAIVVDHGGTLVRLDHIEAAW